MVASNQRPFDSQDHTTTLKVSRAYCADLPRGRIVLVTAPQLQVPVWSGDRASSGRHLSSEQIPAYHLIFLVCMLASLWRPVFPVAKVFRGRQNMNSKEPNPRAA